MDQISLERIQQLIMRQAKEKGWGEEKDKIIVAEKIALIHSEVSEAFEAYRHKNIDGKDGFQEELADVIIRVLHLCGIMEIDIENEILKKLDYNKNREWNWQEMNETYENNENNENNEIQ